MYWSAKERCVKSLTLVWPGMCRKKIYMLEHMRYVNFPAFSIPGSVKFGNTVILMSKTRNCVRILTAVYYSLLGYQ